MKDFSKGHIDEWQSQNGSHLQAFPVPAPLYPHCLFNILFLTRICRYIIQKGHIPKQ